MAIDNGLASAAIRIEPFKKDIELAKNGDESAMFRLYTAYSKAMLNTSFRILNHREDAEDVLQDAFVKAFSRLHQFKYDSSFGSWLKRIVVNASIDQLKSKKVNLELTESDGETVDDAPLFEREEDLQSQLDAVYDALHKLPDGYRTVLSLYMLEGYDHQEISGILNIGVSSSISQLSRAKKKLKSLLLNVQDHG
jgi:RNA polymerase sigma factor (sigma-70 family)